MHIEVVKGKRKWFWRLIASNGQVVLTSQRYYSKWSAKRSALKLALVNKYELRVVNRNVPVDPERIGLSR
jgi:uncharacterized protein YegP (UPF0339 family)